jgi:hypothetical protein
MSGRHGSVRGICSDRWASAITIRLLNKTLSVAHGAAALHVDYGAHFGGVLLGGVLGVLLLLSWGERSPLPGYRVSAAVLAGVMMLSFATAGLAVAQWYPGFAVVAAMR